MRLVVTASALALVLVVALGALAEETAAPPPTAPSGGAAAEARRKVWLASEFRCRAISTTRMRPCRIETKDGRSRLTFPKSEITCTVGFDEAGDPTHLTECRGDWLDMPETNELRRAKKQPIWTGSRKGWRWKEDGEEYCCPGLWIEAPKALR